MTVNDTENPTISCVGNQTKDTDAGECDYTVVGTEFDPTSYDDNCPGATISNDYTSTSTLAGAVFPKGTTTVIWTVTDGSTNTATCSFDVTVEDNENPSITCPANLTVDRNNPYSWTGTGLSPTIDDNCGISTLEYQMNGTNGSWTNGDANDFAFPVGTTTVYYKVTDGEGNETTCSFDVTVKAIPFTGQLVYHNTANTAMNGVSVILKDADGVLPDIDETVVTDGSGNFSFTDVGLGTWEVHFSTTKPNTGAINATDAALLNYWYVQQLINNNIDIEMVRFNAGDPDLTNKIDINDPAEIQNYFLAFGNYTFTRGNWTFWTQGDIINKNPYPTLPDGIKYYPEIQVDPGDEFVSESYYSLVVCDFNRNLIPASSKTGTEYLTLNHEGSIGVSPYDHFDLPVYAARDMEVGAISLLFDVPADQFEVTGVSFGNNPEIPVEYAVQGDELRISWFSIDPVNLVKGDELLTIHMRATGLFNSTETYIGLADNILNELADAEYNTIPDAAINMGVINGVNVGITEPDASADIHFDNHPNPFKGTTNFTYVLPADGHVTIELHDMVGNKVKQIHNGMQTTGEHEITMKAETLQPGIYTATLIYESAGNAVQRTIKIISR